MLKKFLVGLVVLCGSSVANAALLVNYSFSGTNGATSWTPTAGDYGPTGGNPANFSDILTAGAFSNVGNNNGIPGSIHGASSAWRTALTGGGIQTLPNLNNTNQFTLAPKVAIGSGAVTINSMSFNMGKTTTGNGNLINVRIDYRPNPTASWIQLGNGVSLSNNTLKANTINFTTPIVINSGSATHSFRFAWSRENLAGSNSAQAAIDDISLFGTFGAPTFVPEPASLAVFGSFAAFGLLGRYRRK
jgi:hypothetical protein